jgi:hypothetical protein
VPAIDVANPVYKWIQDSRAASIFIYPLFHLGIKPGHDLGKIGRVVLSKRFLNVQCVQVLIDNLAVSI